MGTREHGYPSSVITISVSNSFDSPTTNILKAIKVSTSAAEKLSKSICSRLYRRSAFRCGRSQAGAPHRSPEQRLRPTGVRKQKPEGSKFEELDNDLFRKTLKPVEQVLKDTGTRKEDIDDVLVGGSAEPSKAINPDEAVAWDAALLGGILSGEKGTEEVLLVDGCPLTLGIDNPGGVFTKIIPARLCTCLCFLFADSLDSHTPLGSIPTKMSRTFTTRRRQPPQRHLPTPQSQTCPYQDNNILGKFGLNSIPTGAT
ncbi:ATPase with role in protein import into the ER [Tulasnella sp. 417]|nr:ATPase with role in protein import into the ER [Tulasnella sp. 417]